MVEKRYGSCSIRYTVGNNNKYGNVMFLYVFLPEFMWELQKTLLQ